MFEPISFPIHEVAGPLSALVLLFVFAIGHAIADFPLQGDFLSHGKNRNSDVIRLADGKENPKNLWVYLMSAHCLIHAGFVLLISGLVVFAVAEFILHWLIDVAKCEGRTSFAMDQWLHIATKAVYVLILWFGVA